MIHRPFLQQKMCHAEVGGEYLYPILLHVHVNSVNHTAGPMSRMSNKRDFHIIMVKMLNDLSAEDNVRRSLNAGF